MSRNPKDLREMVENSHKDMDNMQLNLAKLKALSEDDKTENAMLRSRINEQSQLIMILKQRADEATLSLSTLEKINKNLEEFRDGAEEELALQLKKYNMLDARFNDLASNHEEMIKIKDEYKARNSELMQENARLREENSRLFSKAIEEKDCKIAELNKKVLGLRSQCSNMENRCRDLQKVIQELEEAYKQTTKELRHKLDETDERLKGATSRLQHLTTAQQAEDKNTQLKLAQATKERDDLLDLAMSRGKIIQDKQTENKKLQQRIEEMEKAVRDMQDKFEREAAAVNVNLQVRKLQSEMAEVTFKYEDANREFEAYKKHASSLLEKERELNARLRHLVG